MEQVLVVDDDNGIREVISAALLDAGYEVLNAENGRQGVTVARQEQPPVILMDLMMPLLDGAEAIRILKEDPATAWMRIVAMSAGGNLRRQTGRLIMADGLLGKPFDLDELLAEIELQLSRIDRRGDPTGDTAVDAR